MTRRLTLHLTIPWVLFLLISTLHLPLVNCGAGNVSVEPLAEYDYGSVDPVPAAIRTLREFLVVKCLTEKQGFGSIFPEPMRIIVDDQHFTCSLPTQGTSLRNIVQRYDDIKELNFYQNDLLQDYIISWRSISTNKYYRLQTAGKKHLISRAARALKTLTNPTVTNSSRSSSGCQNDMDCKGDRVCENGRCMNP